MGIKFLTPGAVIGTDFAGEIVQMHGSVGELRPDLGIGDMVCGLVHGSNPADPGNGAFAEYVRVPAFLAIKCPEDLDIHRACSLRALRRLQAGWHFGNIYAYLRHHHTRRRKALTY
ncbi:hypothetical protein ONZ43_g5764 [Nemania bipapillata]|uniref:Uncharacterized protein n=1 Tax=Nemania bipapillata TaxID=110536 RepID=A0ACC2I6S7_9PEZI|nr:hypothetical protein ONZ43_g5764 [Nemania bipapillata]